MNAILNHLSSYNKRSSCRLNVVGFPCNQFGHQEPGKNGEIMNGLKYVRPGDGYVPMFELLERGDVNGENEDSMFTYLKANCPRPVGSEIISSDKVTLWKPIKSTDIRWNFEKFLVDHEGKLYKRFSHDTSPYQMMKDVVYLLKKCVADKDGV